MARRRKRGGGSKSGKGVWDAILQRLCGMCPSFCSSRYSGRMSAEEELTLSPLQKLLRYGKVPWKFITHSLILIFTTIQVCGMTAQLSGYNQASRGTFYTMLYPPDFQFSESNLPIFVEEYYMYSVEDVQRVLLHQVQSYYDFHRKSVGDYAYFKRGDHSEVVVNEYAEMVENWEMEQSSAHDVNDSEVENPRLVVRLADRDDPSVHRQWEYSLSLNNPLGPLNLTHSESRDFFSRLQYMWFRVSVVNDVPKFYRTWVWGLEATYDASLRGGRVALSLRFDQHTNHFRFDLWKFLIHNPLFWTNFIIMFLAVTSLLLSARAITLSWKLYQKVKRRHRQSGTIPWRSLPWRCKLKFFRLWFAVTILGNLLNVIAAVLGVISLATYQQYWSVTKMSLGLGCALAWVNMIRYLEYDTRYYVLINTMKIGMPNVFRFLVCVGPIFMGYALFGVAVFSDQSPKYWTVGNACVALFAVANGDIIQDSFTEIYGGGWLISRIYLYSFISLFIYIVLNVFIQLIQDGYKIARLLGNPNHPKARKLDGLDSGVDEQVWSEILRIAKDDGDKCDAAAQYEDSSDSSDDASDTRPLRYADVGGRSDHTHSFYGDGPADELGQLTSQISRLLDTRHQQFNSETMEQVRMLLESHSSQLLMDKLVSSSDEDDPPRPLHRAHRRGQSRTVQDAEPNDVESPTPPVLLLPDDAPEAS